MKINLNPKTLLSHATHTSRPLVNALRAGVLTFAFYVALWGVFGELPASVQSEGLFAGKVSLQPWAEKKAHALVGHFSQRNLALNFLANQRSLSLSQAHDFQTSGIMHLLAISGGQVSPLAKLGSWFFTLGFAFLAAPFALSRTLLRFCGFVQSTVAALLAFFVAALFGNTGALLRVGILQFGARNPVVRSAVGGFAVMLPFLGFHTLLRSVLFAFLVAFFGNPFQNPSFLLSALGATLASLSFVIWEFLSKRMSSGVSGLSSTSRASLIQSRLHSAVFPQVLATVGVAIVLAPLFQVSLVNSICANLFSLPLVNFAITPLSLLALLLPVEHPFQKIILPALNATLEALAFCARVFAGSERGSPFAAGKALFSEQAMLYFSGVLFLLWTCLDTFVQFRLFKLASKHLPPKR